MANIWRKINTLWFIFVCLFWACVLLPHSSGKMYEKKNINSIWDFVCVCVFGLHTYRKLELFWACALWPQSSGKMYEKKINSIKDFFFFCLFVCFYILVIYLLIFDLRSLATIQRQNDWKEEEKIEVEFSFVFVCIYFFYMLVYLFILSLLSLATIKQQKVWKREENI